MQTNEPFDLFEVICYAGLLAVPVMSAFFLLAEWLGKKKLVPISATLVVNPANPKDNTTIRAKDVVNYFPTRRAADTRKGEVINFFPVGRETFAHIRDLDNESSNTYVLAIPVTEIEEILDERA